MTAAPDAVLDDPTLSEQERANIALVLKFRSASSLEERGQYTVPGFKPSRIGMANLFETRPPDTPGYSPGSIPDRQEEFLDIIVRGNRLWASWLVRGTHLGPMLGLAPSGRQIEVLEVGQWRIEDGLIAEAWFFVDELALLRQIGQWPVGIL
jgi:hypothetical protein